MRGGGAGAGRARLRLGGQKEGRGARGVGRRSKRLQGRGATLQLRMTGVNFHVAQRPLVLICFHRFEIPYRNEPLSKPNFRDTDG